jgi:uncharacterized protein YjbJ (UPF0337 family)
MGFLSDLGQKFKGMFQQAQGEAQMNESGVKGGLSKVKGKANEEIADAKLNSRQADDDLEDW